MGGKSACRMRMGVNSIPNLVIGARRKLERHVEGEAAVIRHANGNGAHAVT